MATEQKKTLVDYWAALLREVREDQKLDALFLSNPDPLKCRFLIRRARDGKTIDIGLELLPRRGYVSVNTPTLTYFCTNPATVAKNVTRAVDEFPYDPYQDPTHPWYRQNKQ